MKRLLTISACLLVAAAAAAAQPLFGEIEYVEGDVTLSRGGKSQGVWTSATRAWRMIS